MKHFRFLIIDDKLIGNRNLFDWTLEDNQDNSVHSKENNEEKDKEKRSYYVRKNNIYVYKASREIVFMSSKYPNIPKVSSLSGYYYDYTLVDNSSNKVEKLLYKGYTTHRKNIDKKKDDNKEVYRHVARYWSHSRDKKGERIVIDPVIHGDNIIQYLRIGGHLESNGMRLHEYVYFSQRRDEKVGFSRENERIHHKGHSFDNRFDYLARVSVNEHRLIHNKWEPQNGIWRPRSIQLGLNFTQDNQCNCSNYDCRNCNAVLYIETEKQLDAFISSLLSNDYLRLKDERYDNLSALK